MQETLALSSHHFNAADNRSQTWIPGTGGSQAIHRANATAPMCPTFLLTFIGRIPGAREWVFPICLDGQLPWPRGWVHQVKEKLREHFLKILKDNNQLCLIMYYYIIGIGTQINYEKDLHPGWKGSELVYSNTLVSKFLYIFPKMQFSFHFQQSYIRN